MKRKIFITAALAACFTICLAVAGGLAGKWKGSLKDDRGNDHQVHLSFIVINGEKLIGTAEAEGNSFDINDGKINGDNFSFNIKNQDGTVTPLDGRYIAAGDSVSLNFTESNIKHHVTLVRDDK